MTTTVSVDSSIASSTTLNLTLSVVEPAGIVNVPGVRLKSTPLVAVPPVTS